MTFGISIKFWTIKMLKKQKIFKIFLLYFPLFWIKKKICNKIFSTFFHIIIKIKFIFIKIKISLIWYGKKMKKFFCKFFSLFNFYFVKSMLIPNMWLKMASKKRGSLILFWSTVFSIFYFINKLFYEISLVNIISNTKSKLNFIIYYFQEQLIFGTNKKLFIKKFIFFWILIICIWYTKIYV